MGSIEATSLPATSPTRVLTQTFSLTVKAAARSRHHTVAAWSRRFDSTAGESKYWESGPSAVKVKVCPDTGETATVTEVLPFTNTAPATLAMNRKRGIRFFFPKSMALTVEEH